MFVVSFRFIKNIVDIGSVKLIECQILLCDRQCLGGYEQCMEVL